MISYINLLSVSIIEMKKDLAAQKFSWALVLGRKRAHVLLYVVFIATFIIYIIYRFNALTVETEPLMRIYMFMLLAHMVVYSNHEKLEKGEWYRKLSELIFWWPVLILLFYK
jgi:1,4-dihydroxy-2-naphthoate octaprenyltransferase